MVRKVVANIVRGMGILGIALVLIWLVWSLGWSMQNVEQQDPVISESLSWFMYFFVFFGVLFSSLLIIYGTVALRPKSHFSDAVICFLGFIGLLGMSGHILGIIWWSVVFVLGGILLFNPNPYTFYAKIELKSLGLGQRVQVDARNRKEARRLIESEHGDDFERWVHYPSVKDIH